MEKKLIYKILQTILLLAIGKFNEILGSHEIIWNFLLKVNFHSCVNLKVWKADNEEFYFNQYSSEAWIQTQDGKNINYYKAVGKVGEQVILSDPSRDVYVKLDSARAYWGEINWFFKNGNWENSSLVWKEANEPNYFIQTSSGDWLETHNGTKFADFKLIGKIGDQVILTDPWREMYVKLDSTGAYWGEINKHFKNGNWI